MLTRLFLFSVPALILIVDNGAAPGVDSDLLWQLYVLFTSPQNGCFNNALSQPAYYLEKMRTQHLNVRERERERGERERERDREREREGRCGRLRTSFEVGTVWTVYLCAGK